MYDDDYDEPDDNYDPVYEWEIEQKEWMEHIKTTATEEYVEMFFRQLMKCNGDRCGSVSFVY